MLNSGSEVLSVLSAMIIAALTTAMLAALARVLALRAGALDRPGARSSHTVITPTGGGVAIAVVVIAALAAWAVKFPVDRWVASVTGSAAALIAGLGLADDLRPIAARYRLAVQLVIVTIWLVLLPYLPGSALLGRLPGGSAVLFVMLLLAVTWMVNLYNFMDGIDGIASVQAVTVFGGAALLLAQHGEPSWAWLLLVWAGATAGFLVLNWPPARLFMGDVGSSLLGFVVAAVAFMTVADGGMMMAVWLILMACFFADATATLLIRVARKQVVAQAHRSHAYQILARRWRSHGRVTILVGGVNLCWLLPLAWLVSLNPDVAWVVTIIAYLPLVAVIVWSGAGGIPPPFPKQ